MPLISEDKKFIYMDIDKTGSTWIHSVIGTGQENHDEGAKRPNEGLAPWMN